MALAPVPPSIRQKLMERFPNTTEIQFGPVGGGCINETYQLSFGNDRCFCKINSATKFPQLFEREANGLKLIAKQKRIKVPEVIDCFEADGQQVLLLEWIEEGERTEDFWKKFGEQLAALHQVSHEYFGLQENNYMGSVPQLNEPSNEWIGFFIGKRLQPLVEKCLLLKLLTPLHQSRFENLYKHLPDIFETQSKPSLLHGDLWSGNFMCSQTSEAVLIDTAVYFGHPSIDLGMTTLFGGFRPGFYEAYHHYSAFPPNYREQWEVCNLYPLLIHLLLFGTGYRRQIEQTLNNYD